jgi:hypothetical protein
MIPRHPNYKHDAIVRDILQDLKDQYQIPNPDDAVDEALSAVEKSQNRQKRKKEGFNKKLKDRQLAFRTAKGGNVLPFKNGKLAANSKMKKAIPDDIEKAMGKHVQKQEQAKKSAKKKGHRDTISISVPVPKPKKKAIKVKKARLIPSKKDDYYADLTPQKKKAKIAIKVAAKNPSKENIKSVTDAAKDLGKSVKHAFKKNVDKIKDTFDVNKLAGKVKNKVKGFFKSLVCDLDLSESTDEEALFEAFYEGFMDGANSEDTFHDAVARFTQLS